MSRALSYFSELRVNFKPNFFAFLAMRITGVALALYLFLHIWSIGQIQRGEIAFDAKMMTYDNPVGWALEYLLLLAVLYHMMNGLRLIAADFFGLTDRQSGMLSLAAALTAILGAGSVLVFFPVALDILKGLIPS